MSRPTGTPTAQPIAYPAPQRHKVAATSGRMSPVRTTHQSRAKATRGDGTNNGGTIFSAVKKNQTRRTRTAPATGSRIDGLTVRRACLACAVSVALSASPGTRSSSGVDYPGRVDALQESRFEDLVVRGNLLALEPRLAPFDPLALFREDLDHAGVKLHS